MYPPGGTWTTMQEGCNRVLPEEGTSSKYLVTSIHTIIRIRNLRLYYFYSYVLLTLSDIEVINMSNKQTLFTSKKLPSKYEYERYSSLEQ